MTIDRSIVNHLNDYFEAHFKEYKSINIDHLLDIFNPSQAEDSLSFFIDIRKMALYLIERLMLLPEITHILYVRSQVFNHLCDIFPYKFQIGNISDLDPYIDSAFNLPSKTQPGKVSDLYHNLSVFFHYFLQLANPSRRYAEVTYTFFYEYTKKMETLLKLDDRVNFVITSNINGVDYIQLVFDTVLRENLMDILPYQFLRPKIAMVISSDLHIDSLQLNKIDTDFLLIAGDGIKGKIHGKQAYLLPFAPEDYSFRYFRQDFQSMVVKRISY